MTETYTPLPSLPLEPGSSYQRPDADLPERVQLDSPALSVMTDLTKIPAVTISPSASLAEANQTMIAARVRLLLVVDENRQVVGLITSTDLLGEKPMLHARKLNMPVQDLSVADIMIAQPDLDVLDLRVVERARVGDVAETLKSQGRRHALVVERTDSGMTIRGIFSCTQISKQLGIPLEDSNGRAETFTELKEALIAS